MADISKITLGQTTYDIKDAVVRGKIGQTNGIAELNGNGKVPASQLPSYVDDIVNGYYHEGNFYEDDTYQTLITPTTGKIYYDLATGKQYRWSDVVYVEVKDTQPMTASEVSYSNTNSTLSSDNVQGAIDELDRKIYDAGNYETVLLTVKSTSSSFSPVGQTITVTLAGGETMDFEVDSSLSITFTVQKGITYTITGTSTADYRCVPLSARASLNVRNLTINYIPINTGVFVILNTGETYTYDEYDATTMASDTVGVMLVTSGTLSNGFGIVIAKDDVNTLIDRSVILQSISGTNVTSTTLYNGPANTQYGVAQSRSWATTCANNYKSIAGNIMQGYAGAVRDWQDVRNNIGTINAYLTLIGGTTLQPAASSGTSTYSGSDKGMVRADQYNPPYVSSVISMYYRPFYKYTLS
jgi:hypothetical protein